MLLNCNFIKLDIFQMELFLLGLNGTILSILYGKLLEYGGILGELRARIASLEGAIIERRKPIRGDCHLDRDELL